MLVPNPGKSASNKQLIGSRAPSVSGDSIELHEVTDTPEPLRRIDGHGLDLWNRTWSLGQTWISQDTDIELLQLTCEMVDEREQLRSYVLENIDAWHERRALRDLDKAIVSNLSLLGFTPTDRMRLGVSQVKAKSKLEELMERRANREDARG
jgi:hypothetical protein